MGELKKELRERKEIVPVIPTKFEDVENVIGRLKRREGVIIDLENVPPQIARRMLDFLSGAVFALKGSVKKIKYRTYILIPDGVKISTVRCD